VNVLEKIMGELQNTISVDSQYAKFVAGNESVSAEVMPVVESKRADLAANVEAALEAISLDSRDGIEFKPHQIEVAKKVALAAVDPIGTLNKIATKGRQNITVAGEHNVVDTTKFMDEYIPDNKIMVGAEAFDGQNVSQSIFFSVVFNSLVVDADPVNELFYPIVIIDNDKTGATVTAKIASLMTTTKRDVTGKPLEIKKESIIKNLNNTKMFTLDSNRLYPVLANDADGRLLHPDGVGGLVRTVEVFEGTKVETAPYKTRIETGVLEMSQTEELISRGVMDFTDSLNAHLVVDKLYFKVVGKNSDGDDVEEYHARVIKGLPAVFTYTPTGHNKDLQLDYKTDSLAWTGGKVVKADGTPTEIDDLAKLPAGYVAKLKLNLKGDANTEKGSVEIHPLKIALAGVLDASGNELSEDDDEYKKMKAIFDAIDVVGFDLEAYANNINARFRGKMLTTDRYTTIYTVPVRAKLREVTSVFSDGDDGNTAGLLGQIQFNKQALTKNGLLELNNTAAVLENISFDTDAYGITSKLVSKKFHREAIDLTTLVDGLTSSDRIADIKAALELKLKNVALELYVDSGYNKTFEAVYPGVKPTVIIGVDTNMGRFISSFEDELFKYEVAVSNDVLMSGKIFLSFSVMGGNRHKEPNPLSFGVCFWSPEVTIALQRQENGTVVQETITMPRYKHQTLMPILALLEVSGVDEVSGKISKLIQNV